MPRHVGPLLAVLVAATAFGACTGNDVTGSTIPTTETFTGTLLPMGSTTFAVTVKGDGELDATLTSLAPQTTITVGLAIGEPLSGTCQFITGVENAKAGQTLPAPVAAGSYCVTLYDVGNVQGADSFVLSVVHP